MPSYASVEPPAPDLDLLARNLDLDTIRCKRLIRQFLDTNPEAFLRSALRVLEQPDTHGARYILALLTERGLLLRVLCAPGVAKERALQLARAAISAAPSADIQIARGLGDMLASEGAENFNQITLLMDILADISDAARVFPALVRLMRHPNPHVRSKAVLMIGRRSRSAQWVRHRLADSDPRIRANALEAIWNVDTAEARDLLEGLVNDSNNRVAGNAMLGLYLLGQASVIPQIVAMAGHASALFRSTAAWVMGISGDPRFTEVLAGLLRETNGTVRKRAFAALGQIRRAAARSAQAPPGRMAARFTEISPSVLRLSLTVAGAAGGTIPDLLATQLIPTEDGQIVHSYRFSERPVPETLFTVFFLPVNGETDAWRQAALACLPWKRPTDLWACDFYESAAQEAGSGSAPGFQTSLDLIRAEFARTPLRLECPGLWRAIRRVADVEAGPLIGKRHLIVFHEQPLGVAVPDDLMAGIAAAQVTVHAVATVPDPVLEEVCRKSNGSYTAIGSIAGAAEGAIRTYLGQVPQYEISWQPLRPEPGQVKIRIHSADVSVETSLAVPPRP